MACLVREPRRADEIADGVNTGFAGAAVLVDHNVRAIDFYPGAFQADTFHVADDADGGDTRSTVIC